MVRRNEKIIIFQFYDNKVILFMSRRLRKRSLLYVIYSQTDFILSNFSIHINKIINLKEMVCYYAQKVKHYAPTHQEILAIFIKLI